MANPDCVEQANCDGTPMTEGDYTYCTKHFLSESAYLQIRALEAKNAALKSQLAESEGRRLTTRMSLHCPDCSEKRQAGEG